MALQTSGQITLNEIHIEAGGGSGTQCTQGDADIRGLIGKAASTQSALSEWYGASGSASFIGAVTQSLGFASDVTAVSLDLSGIVQAGDLVVIAITSRDDLSPGGLNTTGGFVGTRYETITGDTRVFNPGWCVFAGTFASGNSTTIGISQTTGSSYTKGRYINSVAAVYRDVATFRNSGRTLLNTGRPNPPAIASVTDDTKLILAIGHLDDDAVAMTAPSGYTLAGNAFAQNGSTAIAHLITDSSTAQDPGAFGGTGDDGNVGVTLRFGS